MRGFKRCFILLAVAMLMFSITGCGAADGGNTAGEKIKDFQGASFTASDGSVIYFEEDGDFAWYLSDEDHNDNYYFGKCELYFGKGAEDFIVNGIPEFGVTQEELDTFMSLNEGDEFYNEENFCCMVLDNREFKMDGQLKEVEDFKSYYMGFYADGYYDAANMMSGKYYGFTKK